MLLLVNRQIMYYKKKSVNKEICNSLKTLDNELRHLYCIIYNVNVYNSALLIKYTGKKEYNFLIKEHYEYKYLSSYEKKNLNH